MRSRSFCTRFLGISASSGAGSRFRLICRRKALGPFASVSSTPSTGLQRRLRLRLRLAGPLALRPPGCCCVLLLGPLLVLLQLLRGEEDLRSAGRPGRSPSVGLALGGEEDRGARPRRRRRRRRRPWPGCPGMPATGAAPRAGAAAAGAFSLVALVRRRRRRPRRARVGRTRRWPEGLGRVLGYVVVVHGVVQARQWAGSDPRAAMLDRNAFEGACRANRRGS